MNRLDFIKIVKNNINEVEENEINKRAATMKSIVDVVAKQELENIRLSKKLKGRC